eukprot:1160491-Pelagomonas_calceolata.AAC.6
MGLRLRPTQIEKNDPLLAVLECGQQTAGARGKTGQRLRPTQIEKMTPSWLCWDVDSRLQVHEGECGCLSVS